MTGRDSGPGDVRGLLSEAWRELLHVDGVSSASNFYAEGGTSVTAMILLATMLDKGFHARLSELVACRTFGEQLALFASGRAEEGGTRAENVLTAKQELQLTRISEEIRARGIASAKPVPLVVEVSGAIDHDLLSQSIVALVRRHEVLATAFIDARGEIAPAHTGFADTWKPERIDLTAFSPAEALARIWEIIDDVARAGLAYDSTPVILGAVAAVSADLTYAVLVVDHLVSDAESLDVLYEELTEIYSAIIAGRPSGRSARRMSAYTAPVEKERYGVAGWPVLAAKWREYFADYREPPAFDLLGPVGDRDYRETVPSTTTVTKLVLPAETMAKLRATYRRLGLPPLSIMLGATHVAAHIVSGQRDICVVNPRSRRNGRSESRVVNDFAEPTVIRLRQRGTSCLCDLTLAEVAAMAAESQAKASELEMPRAAVTAFAAGDGGSVSRAMIGAVLRAAADQATNQSPIVAEPRTDRNDLPWLWCNYIRSRSSARPMGGARAKLVEQDMGGVGSVSNLMVYLVDDDNELAVSIVAPDKLYPQGVIAEFGAALMAALREFAADPDGRMSLTGRTCRTARTRR